MPNLLSSIFFESGEFFNSRYALRHVSVPFFAGLPTELDAICTIPNLPLRQKRHLLGNGSSRLIVITQKDIHNYRRKRQRKDKQIIQVLA